MNLDAEILMDVIIKDKDAPFTYVKVDIPYLNKKVEVKVPNNIKEGQRIRLEKLGYSDSFGNRGDLLLIISKVTIFDKKETKTMQKIFWVKNGDLDEVNNFLLQRDGRVKSIHALSESVAAYGYAGGETSADYYGNYVGDIYAYVVVEFD